MVNQRQLFGGLGNTMFQMAYIYAQFRRGELPDIYLQDEKYFESVKDEIKLWYGQGMSEIDMVGIHVRRTDYINNPFYVDLTETSYYEKAMSLFPDEDFLVFSDDIEWCKRQSIFEGCEFSENKSAVEDLNLLASCKGIIMANSSFSWWAAYLSKAKVIAPKEWHPDGVERTVCPKEWIQI